MKQQTVWIVDDDQSIRWVLQKTIDQTGHQAICFEDAEDMLDALSQTLPDCILTDIRMPGIDGLALLARLQSDHPDIPVVVMTAHSDLDSAVQAYDGGAFEYLPKPFDIDEVTTIVERALATREESQAKQEDPLQKNAIIGESAAMQEVFRAIGRLAKSNISVLVTGASGTGKERVAQALHQHSPRKHAPFVALNMAAIPKDLIESELFGHAKGAFTGASTNRIGRFQQADGGTLFLDEIGDMPADTQTRLLRVLAEGKFYPVGASNPVDANVRIVAATHQDLEKLVEKGEFREDLFHRLNVIRIQLPTLDERREDILMLARHFLALAAKEMEVEPKILSQAAAEHIQALNWPGNVRQLENCCRWMTVMSPGREITINDFPPEMHGVSSTQSATTGWQSLLRTYARSALNQQTPNLLQATQQEVERILIDEALSATSGRKAEAAELLGCGRNTLTRKLKELEMN